MNQTLTKYENKKINYQLGNPNKFPQKRKYQYFIIIPSFAEKNFLKLTLKSINEQNTDLLENTLVVIVINNSANDTIHIKKNNYDTFKIVSKLKFKYEFIIIDCFSSNHQLSNEKSGVGMARKIGHDFCIKYSNFSSLFFSLDADCLLHEDYLEVISNKFKKNDIGFATINFKHQKNDNVKIQQGIKKYEKLLKTIAFNIESTGSPYGYVSLGSAIVCTMKAYISVGGMPAKKATEDFYFLQRLAKFSKPFKIDNILVFPSSRCESRVYLGTGFRLSNLKKNFLSDLSIDKEAYRVLKSFFKTLSISWNSGIEEIVLSCSKKNSKLRKYLNTINFENTIYKIQKNSKTEKQFMNQFHIWFDSLKIYKFLKLYVD